MLSKIYKLSKIARLAKFTPTTFAPICKPYFAFSTIILSPQHLSFSDVVKVHQDKNGHFLNLPGRVLNLDKTSAVGDVKNKAISQYKNISIIKFYDEKLVEFSNTTSVDLLLKENFLIKINEEWYSVITELEDPLFNVKTNHDLGEQVIYDLCEKAGFSERQTATLGKFVSSLTKDLYDHAHSQVDNHLVQTIVQKNLYSRSIEAKTTIESLNMKLAFLRQKLADFEAIKAKADRKLLAYANKRLKWFASFIFAQLMAIQYGTYIAFSWDVMEPITCLLGIIDVIIAYSFWLNTNKSYTYHNIGMNYIEGRKAKMYKQLGFDEREYEETKKLIQLLETQKLLLSPKINDLLKSLHLFGQDTSNKEEEEDD